MQVHDEFSGTITLTENSSRELFKVLKEQDEAFINDVLDGRCGFTLKSADGRSVELVPNTNKRCQCVGSVGADRKTENSSEKPNNSKDEPQTCSVNGRPYDCGNCEYHKCTADEPQTNKEIVLDPSFAELSDEQFVEAMKLIEPQTDCPWK